MKRRLALALSTSVAALALLGCANPMSNNDGWVTLFDGGNLDQWFAIGDANWRVDGGSVVADKGVGFLVSKQRYSDFQIRAEFWADENANSGIFIRLQDTKTVTADNSYEVNIFDKRPAPEYGTGAIVNIAKVVPMPKAAGKWNTYEITAKGSRLVVVFNGVQTVDVQDSKHAAGPIALQYAPGVVPNAGVIKFRKVQIKAL